jgi:5-methyltetrahydropteroyltriglutamate--homocysteine methyltransferase
MPDRILTSHAGSLPRPEELVALNLKRGLGELDDEAGYQAKLTQAVADVVAQQRELGIDLVNDGEFGHSMGHRYDYGPWWTYVFQRLGGLELVTDGVLDIKQAPGKPGELSLASFVERRDWLEFSDAYGDPNSGAALPNPDIGTGAPVCRGPITYTGRESLDRDIANLKAALDAAGVQDGYMNAVAPGSCARFGNEYYEDDQALMYACADALREEYQAIIEAGLILQLDDPAIAENWDQINPEPSVEDYQRFTMLRVEALNHAIQGLPEDRIRFHLCWGSWHGPHVTDIPMRDIVDVMLKINAGAYSFEAANVRHEHEWRVWPRPTAVSAGACTRRSRGRSSVRCRRERGSPASSSGAAGSPRRRRWDRCDSRRRCRPAGLRRQSCSTRSRSLPSGRAPSASPWRRRSATSPGVRP